MGLSLISPKTPEVPKSEREAEKETRQKGNLSERERWGAQQKGSEDVGVREKGLLGLGVRCSSTLM